MGCANNTLQITTNCIYKSFQQNIEIILSRWARDNIENFGGNPSNITLCGVGLGASSAGLHMISPMSKGLFHKAIQHSGTCIAPGEANQLHVNRSLISKIS